MGFVDIDASTLEACILAVQVDSWLTFYATRRITQGERVRRYVIEGDAGGKWQELCRGTAIGHKKIDRFPPVEVAKVRFVAQQSAATPQIRKLAVYAVGP